MDPIEAHDQSPSPDGSETPSTEAAGRPNKDQRTLAMLCHLLGALTGFVVPLIIWLIKKEDMPFIDDQGKEALNFQLTVLIAFVAVGVLGIPTCGLATFLALPLWIADIVFGIMAAMEANEGRPYRYPVTIRMIQ